MARKPQAGFAKNATPGGFASAAVAKKESANWGNVSARMASARARVFNPPSNCLHLLS